MFKKQAGLTLIEMALALVIIGLLLGVSFTLIDAVSKANRNKKTKNNLEITKDALIGYLLSQGRLPYAANDVNGNEDNTTPSYTGKVPYRTIGLPKTSASDAYGQVFSYDVTGSTLTNAKLTDTTYQNVCHQLQALIDGTNPATARVTLDGTNYTGVAFVLLAPGNNKQYEGENNDGDRDYRSQDPNSDDVVIWETFANLYAKLDCGQEYYIVHNGSISSIWVKGGKYTGCTEIAAAAFCYLKKDTEAYSNETNCNNSSSKLFDFSDCESADFGVGGDRDTKVRWNGFTVVDE
ncbi:MAG: type II secretion system protein [Deltaproteobacteria bacterium]|nr:type II secretion system protein [Deltaproteobacteria bacterium]